MLQFNGTRVNKKQQPRSVLKTFLCKGSTMDSDLILSVLKAQYVWLFDLK